MKLSLENIKGNLNAFRSEKTIRLANRIYLGIMFSEFLIILLFLRGLPPQIPLFYSLPWGEEQLTSPVFLLILPLGCLLAGIINFSLAASTFPSQPLASKILVWLNVIVSSLSVYTLLRVVFLVI